MENVKPSPALDINYKKLASKVRSLIGLIEHRLFEKWMTDLSPYNAEEMLIEVDLNSYNKYKNYVHRDMLMDNVIMHFAARGYTAVWNADGGISISFNKDEAIDTIINNKWKTLEDIKNLSPKELRLILQENFTCTSA